ncbi:hypothetical protein [Nocardioides sp. YIM 152315]|uniref:hypothetical protein n=1 Tax=Nocardioides sp. YIM 152315 TaxID=3031760 RepID=UPI0023DAB67A|nr:hypothetical protein [Nocardioides sp. YIM 152315]
MTTYWICVAHRFAIPPTACTARGENDKGAADHTAATKHPTLTTTRRALADRLACGDEGASDE